MAVRKGEIVEVNFPLPNGFKPHPVLVISNNEVNEAEEALLGMMLSTKNFDEEFTFEITDEMVTKPAKKQRFAVLHLVAIISEKEIIGRYGSIKEIYLNEILDKFKKVVI